MWFHKVSILPNGKSLEIPRGVGGGAGLKAKLLEFPGGRGVQNKKPSMEGGGVWIFSGTTHYSSERSNKRLIGRGINKTKLYILKFNIILSLFILRTSLCFCNNYYQ